MIPVPYSDKKSDNETRFPCKNDDQWPCLLCGRPVNRERAPWVRVHDGGYAIVTKAEAEERNAAGDEGADMLCFPVGPDCWRKHPELHSYRDDIGL